MPGYALETEGLKETLDGLDKVARMDVTRDLKAEFATLASQVISRAHGKASTPGQRKAADTLAQASTGTAAAVRFGKGFDGAFGQEFGADRNKRRVVNHFGYFTGWNQFPAWRGSDAGAGYFLWPAIREVAKENTELLADSVAAIIAARPAPNIAAGAALIDSIMGKS